MSDAEAHARSDAEAPQRGDAEGSARSDAEVPQRSDAEGSALSDAEVPQRGDAGVPARSDAGGGLGLAGTVEALLFLASDPLTLSELADATEAVADEVLEALASLAQDYAPGRRGLRLRELAGGWTLASDPAADGPARRLFSRERLSKLSPAQAETLAIIAYLQPVSRPEITRIRGVNADSPTATLLDRGLIEEAGHSQFGAVLYRTGTQFLKLFGLRNLQELPDLAGWDPSPEEESELRERLLRAGEARAGDGL